MTVFVLGLGLYELPSVYGDYVEAQQQTVKALHLRGQIMLYDEILTMSVRMCAATGDAAWDRRYREHELPLDQAIKEAVALFPGSQVALMTDDANRKLVSLESRALALAKQGNLQVAQSVFDAEYRAQKQIFAAGMAEFEKALLIRTDAQLDAARARFGLSMAFACISGLVLAWLATLRRTQLWNQTLLERNRELDRQAQELRNSNFKLKESQAHLLQSQKLELVGTLASGVAHDFNNQLVPILGYVELMLDDCTPQQRSSLAVIESAAKNCRQLVRGLMSLARPSSSEKMVVDPVVLLAELKDFLVQTLPSTILLDLDMNSDLSCLRGNAAELQAVFLNLATNARDAMPSGGQLTVTGRNLGDSVQFCISDNGIGMSEEIQKKIFDPFFTTKGEQTGTGLGLCSVKRVVEDHGGTIELDSQPGKGSRFTLTFPAFGGPGKQAELSPAGLVPARALRILFVDDEETIRRIASRRLTSLGLEVITCCSGLEAIELYQKDHFDVVISDVTMPGMTGLDLLRNLLEIHPEAIVILASGNDIETSHAPGVSAILSKPYDFKQLVGLIMARIPES